MSQVFSDYEDSNGYFQAFKLVFDQAEKDIGKKIPWGHLVSSTDNLSSVRVKAILVDEHGGQIKGLGHYFEQEYPFNDSDWHILRIVKTCRVHYERSIRKLETKGVSKGLYIIYKLLLIVELGNLLRELPDTLLRHHYDHILFTARKEAEANNLTSLLNWLEHKDRNPWVLQCLSLATTAMSREDWRSTSSNTNNAESAHAQSQREGIKLTLLSAVIKGKRLDSRHFEAAHAMQSFGVPVRYGNNSMTGRKMKGIVRQKNIKKREAKGNEGQIDGNELVIAYDLLKAGVSKEVIEEYLNHKASNK